MIALLLERVDSVNIMIDEIHRLIEGGAALDPELAAGLATTESMPSVQRKIDQCSAVIEALAKDLKTLRAAR